MNKQDKFYDQFKEAAGQTEQQRFPGFEEVWQQVENRLDQEEELPQIPAFNYKKWLAIAASFLLKLLAGVAVYQNNKKEVPQIATKKDAEPKPAVIADSNTKNAQHAEPGEMVKHTKTKRPFNKERQINKVTANEPNPATETNLIDFFKSSSEKLVVLQRTDIASAAANICFVSFSSRAFITFEVYFLNTLFRIDFKNSLSISFILLSEYFSLKPSDAKFVIRLMKSFLETP
jgi:hypothetical protein